MQLSTNCPRSLVEYDALSGKDGHKLRDERQRAPAERESAKRKPPRIHCAERGPI